MSFDTVITCHANADNDAIAALVGALLLYPDAVLLYPGSQERQLQEFYDAHYPKRERMPVQREVYKLLKKGAAKE